MHKILPLLLLLCCAYFNKVSAQVQLTDFTFAEGDQNSEPRAFIEFNGLFLYTAITATEGRELWVSDGTTANTHLLKDINPGSSNGVLYFNPVVLGDQLFFIANDGEYGPQLWATKGTAQSTRRITSMPGLTSFIDLSLVGDQIFFTIRNNYKLAVWKSNGTQEGTQLVKKDIAIWNNPSFEGSANQLFFFTIQPEGSNNSRLWRSDGTEAGTFPLTEELDDYGASYFSNSHLTQHIVFRDELYFIARSYNRFPYNENMGIMKTDGTLEGTKAVKGLHDASNRQIDVADVIEINHKLYFSFYEADYNRLFIWETDGTPSGTWNIYDKYAPAYFVPSNLRSDGSRLIFTGPGTDNKTALLTLSTSTYETTEVKQLILYPEKALYHQPLNIIIRLPDNQYNILVETPSYQREGWLSDLTATNTTYIDALPNNSNPPFLYQGNLYFAGQSDGKGRELWKTDLTFSSLELFMNINQSGHGFDANSSFAALDDQILFSRRDPDIGSELWTYQKPSDEVVLVKDIQQGEAPSYPRQFVRMKDHIYFHAYAESRNSALFRSDGTANGTQALSESALGADIAQAVAANEKVYFQNRLPAGHFALSATDGLIPGSLKKWK